MSSLIWEKGRPMDARVRNLTVGEDPLLDQELLGCDLLGSLAHVHMLGEMGHLSPAVVAALKSGLGQLLDRYERGEFQVGDHEDGHSAIEAELSSLLGDAGRSVHLGRSRNDQVALALRLWMRHAMLEMMAELLAFIGAAQSFGLAQEALEWAGQTHLQPAMPSGPALWAQAWVEGGLESARALRFLHSECGRSPLGAAAGFGGAIALDRESVARSLGLLGAHRGVVDALHARARLGQRLLDEGRMIGALLEKLGWDVSLGLTREYGLFRLREGFATGSSVMPQKQNPDLAELVRARGARLSAHAFEHERIACKLPSNYHRDHQLLKGPLLLGVSDVCETLGAARLLLEAVEPDPEGCRRSMRAELDAARVASERALAGVPFRDAYQEVAQSLPGRGFSRGVPEHVRADCSREYAQAAQERQEHADWLAAERSREEAAGRALRAPA